MKKKSELDLAEPHLRRRELREECEGDAIALPAQRLGERAEERDRAPPPIGSNVSDVHRRRCVLQDDHIGAGAPGPATPRLRRGNGDDDERRAATRAHSQKVRSPNRLKRSRTGRTRASPADARRARRATRQRHTHEQPRTGRAATDGPASPKRSVLSRAWGRPHRPIVTPCDLPTAFPASPPPATSRDPRAECRSGSPSGGRRLRRLAARGPSSALRRVAALGRLRPLALVPQPDHVLVVVGGVLAPDRCS